MPRLPSENKPGVKTSAEHPDRVYLALSLREA